MLKSKPMRTTRIIARVSPIKKLWHTMAITCMYCQVIPTCALRSNRYACLAHTYALIVVWCWPTSVKTILYTNKTFKEKRTYWHIYVYYIINFHKLIIHLGMQIIWPGWLEKSNNLSSTHTTMETCNYSHNKWLSRSSHEHWSQQTLHLTTSQVHSPQHGHVEGAVPLKLV